MSAETERTWSKAALLDLVKTEQRDWEALVAAVGPERMTLPGVMDTWSFKDVAAHINGWRQWLVTRLEAAQHGVAPVQAWAGSIPKDGTFEDVNQWLYARHRDDSADTVLSTARNQFERLLAAIEALPEADLLDGTRFEWQRGDALAADIASIATSHFAEDHLPGLRAWLEAHA